MAAPQKLTPFGDAIAGAAGAVFANSLVFPLDVIKTRLQVQTKSLAHLNPNQHYSSALDAFLKILQTDGVAGLYAGLGAGLFGTVASSFSYFYFYSLVRAYYDRVRTSKGDSSIAIELALGAAAGALSQLCTLPIAVVTTRQQTSSRDEKASFRKTLIGIVHDEGVPGLWKGLKASLVLCSNPAITYGMFERVKTIWLRRKSARTGLRFEDLKLGSGEIFLIGALSKTMATVVTYPYIMAKVRMQWKPPKSADQLTEKQRKAIQYTGSIDVLRKVFASEGILGWYKGMNAQITKAVLCQAILFVGKEQFSAYTLMLFAFLAKMRAQGKIAA
ncbi:mitochondrial carrier domain-containing protein [Zopfochytrium polystomum]|nr:mitochondrial carrier domain-containing protein [Zopfochytrium polystomum]